MSARSHKKTRKLTILGVTARVLMLGVALLLALSYLSVLVNPASVWFFSVFGILFVPLFLFNAFLLVWAIFRRSSAALIPLLALLPSFLFVGEYVGFHSQDPDASQLKIISYNVGRFQLAEGQKMKEKECLDSVFTQLKRQKPDVVCLQEFLVDAEVDIPAFCRRWFPGFDCAYFAFPGSKTKAGNVIVSRYPIKEKSSITFDGTTNLVLYADIAFPQRVIRFYNCHLQSYSISLPGLVKSADEGEEYIRQTGQKMRRSILIRPRQVDEILKNIAACPLESLVCGDFNDTPMLHTYQALRKGHDDSFVQAGRGMAATYYYLWPLLRIVYILQGSSLKAVSHASPHWKWSDHYPVIVDFVWNKP